MRTWRSLLASTVLGGALVAGTALAPSPAQAGIDLGGYTGAVKIQYLNYETIIDPQTGNIVPFTSVATGDELVGVLSLQQITAAAGPNIGQVLWSPSASTGYLTGVFAGPVLTITGPNTFTSLAQTTFNIYMNPTPLDPTQGFGGFAAGGCSAGQLCYNSVSNAGGVLALVLQSTPGISSDPAVYSTGSFDFGSVPPGGSFRMDLNVTGGADQTQFDTNGVPTALAGIFADLNLNGQFCTNSDTNCNGGITIGDWEFLSSDPVVGNVVPEPGSLGMLGTALLALGFVGWRSRKRT